MGSWGNRGPREPHRLSRSYPVVLFALILVAPGCLVPPDRHGLENLNAGRPLAGAWLGAWPTDRVTVIRDFERTTGVRLDLVDVYLDWYTPFQNVTHTLKHVAKRGSIPILTWEAQGITTKAILSGSMELPLRNGKRMALDAYLEEFSTGVCGITRETNQPVFMRVLHEMNGNWFAWGVTYQDSEGKRPNSDDSYQRAFIKIHDAFASKCGNDVRFIWAVNHASVGEGASYMGAYPGDAYVDFIGIDGYNWGGQAEWGWQSFEVLFKPAYCAITRASDRPIIIAETASTEKGGDKAEWIRDLYSKVQEYPRLRGVVYFNDAKYEVEIQGTMDWPIDSSDGAARAFSDGVKTLKEADAARTGAAGEPLETVRC